MTKHFKRPLSIILAVLMVISVFIAVPTVASAEPGGASVDYYIVGTMNNWTVSDAYKLTVNPNNSAEYLFQDLSVSANTELKVKDSNDTWYPGGENFTLNSAGTYDIYFRPDGQGDQSQGWYYGNILANNYREPAPTYTVTWKNGEDVLETDTDVAVNANPSYDGETPEKAEDETNTYTFSGWSDGTNTYAANALPEVSGDVTYTAQFTATAKHVHDGITFEKWTSANSLPSTAGNYFLTSDVTISAKWTVSTNIRLCLNGHGITKTGNNDNVIRIVSGGNLTIDDCGNTTHYFDVNNGKAVNVNATSGTNSFTGGYITGGTGYSFESTYFWGEGGGVDVAGGGTFTLNGGTILGNSAGHGGGVCIYSGTMTMNGGTVCYNTASQGGSGIGFRTGSAQYNRGGGATTANFVMNGGTVSNNNNGGVAKCDFSYGDDYATIYGGTITDNGGWGVHPKNLTITGDVTITGNTNGAGFVNTGSISGNPVITGNTDSNLYFANGQVATVGELGENAQMGVTTEALGVFTSGYSDNNSADPETFFTPDEAGTFVQLDSSGEAKLAALTWTASYAAGEGSGTMASVEVQRGRSFNLPTSAFTAPAGKMFGGWSDGTNTYNSGASYTMTADTTFTAQWIDGVIIPKNGTDTLDLSEKTSGYSFLIFDNGGPDNNYQNSSNGTLSITLPEGKALSISGTSNTENNYDWLYVYGGNTGNQLIKTSGGNKPISIFSAASPVILRFTSDSSVNQAGFALNAVIYDVYTVTWKNGDTVLETDTALQEGTTPTYDGTTPEKAEDDNYIYTFSGWSDGSNTYAADALPAVSGDVTYTATFTSTPAVAKIGNAKYATLQDAIDAASSGDTVTLLADIDFSEVTTNRNAHDTGDELKIDLEDLTLDMNGYTITSVNASVVYTGNGATIENGNFALKHVKADGTTYQAGSYGLCIDGYGVENGITLNDLTVEGGINIWDADVEINTTTATATASNFYAIWAEGNSNVVVNSGTFSDNGSSKAKGPIATDSTGTGTTVTIKGGTFNATKKIVNGAAPDSVKIQGGTFTMVVPEEYAAPGFVPSEQNPETGLYTVVTDTSSPLNPLNVAANSINDGNAFGIKTDYLMGTLLGVQAKSIAGENTSSQEGTYNMRFVACLDTDILQSADDYGFVVAKLDDTKDYSNTKIENLKAFWGNGEKTVSAKGTYNNVCGSNAKYGDPTDGSTPYKYITCAINNVSDGDKFVARFYVKIDGKYYYAKYSGHDYKYTGCIASWSDVFE